MSSETKFKMPNSLNEHWMPFTANKDFKENPRLITEAKGMYLKNHHGKTMIDASSGLFCNPFGHGRKEIVDAVTKQLETLDYTQPFQQGFGGSFELATRITKHTPGNLNRIFFSTGGSDAVETAIKISIAYHKANGQGSRFRVVGRERAYHGMHIGGTSVGGMINNVKTYASLLMPGVVHMRHTHLPDHKFISGQPETGVEIAEDLERFASNFGAENIAACIVEPTAGSTGGNHGGKVKDPFDDFSGPQNIGHLFFVMKPNLFVGNYSQRIKENIKRIKRLPKIKGVKEILYPGQSKQRRYKKNLNKEINIPANIAEDLKKLNA